MPIVPGNTGRQVGIPKQSRLAQLLLNRFESTVLDNFVSPFGDFLFLERFDWRHQR